MNGCTRPAQRGFSLVELLVALTILVGILAGAYAGFAAFVDVTETNLTEASAEEDMKQVLLQIKRDLDLAGFVLPTLTRIAAEDATASPGALGPGVDEAAVGVDIDGDGNIAGVIRADRLFIADGRTILVDVTSQHLEDLRIMSAATVDAQVLMDVAGRGGYIAHLARDVMPGSAAYRVDETAPNVRGGYRSNGVSINDGDEVSMGRRDRHNFADIKAQAAVIMAGPWQGVFHVEGRRTAGNDALALHGGESFANGFEWAPGRRQEDGTLVVPAIAWRIQQDVDGSYWLYRNQSRVLRGGVGFQVEYGFDRARDGLEWSDVLPPRSSADLRPDNPARAEVSVLLDQVAPLGGAIARAKQREVLRALCAVRVTLVQRHATATGVAGSRQVMTVKLKS